MNSADCLIEDGQQIAFPRPSFNSEPLRLVGKKGDDMAAGAGCINSPTIVEPMSLIGAFRKTLKRGTNVVRRVGKAARRTVKRGTNVVGLTGKRRVGRKSRRRSSRK